METRPTMSNTATRGRATPPGRASGTGSTAVYDRYYSSRQRRRRGMADLLAIAAWASAAMAVTLWLCSGRALFGSVGQVVTDAGIIAGLIGTDLVLVMLVLAARLPIIDRLVGHDQAMTEHGKLGKPALYLLLGHAGLLILGYALESHVNPIKEAIVLFETGDIFLALVGLLAMIAVVWTTVTAVRRVLPYEGWHLIHLLSYVSVIIAIPHQLSIGLVLAAGTWERIYWLALYVFALGSIGVFRFAVPIIRSVRHDVVVERVERVADDVISIHMRGRNLSALEARGGQFFMWRFWSGGTWWHSHPISLSAAPTDKRLRVTVRALGRGSAELARLRPGTPVSFEGPYGIFTDVTRTSTRIAVAASGIGITPVRAFLETLDAPPGAVTILLRGRSEREAYLWDEVANWARRRGHKVFVSVGPRGHGRAAWLAESDTARGANAGSIFPALRHSDLYICGPQRWGDLVEQDALRHGLPADHLHRERFDW